MASEVNFKPLDCRDHLAMTCHYDDMTLLTRNGELIQAIRVKGWEHYAGSDEEEKLRDLVRKALVTVIPNNDFIVQFIITRDFGDITSSEESPNEMLEEIKNLWNQSQRFSHTLANTLHIVITHRGVRNGIGPERFERNILASGLRLLFFMNLEKSVVALTAVTNTLAAGLKRYGASILKIRKNQEGVYITELLSFFRYLITMNYCEVPLDTEHAAEQIAGDLEIFCDGNRMFLKTALGVKQLVVFSLANAANLNSWAAEKILQTPSKLMISETINFVKKSEAIPVWQSHFEIAKASHSHDLIEIGGLSQVMEISSKQANAFCRQQTLFHIYGENDDELQSSIKKFTQIAADVGVSIIREDVGANGVYWSQFPGNMHLINRRYKYNTTSNAAIFTNTWPRAMGYRFSSRWGAPLFILSDIETASPYYFHFYDKAQKEGHCLLFSNTEKNQTEVNIRRQIIGHSLAAQPFVVNIDLDGQDRQFMEQLGAKRLVIGEGELAGISLFDLAQDLHQVSNLTGDILDMVCQVALPDQQQQYRDSDQEEEDEEQLEKWQEEIVEMIESNIDGNDGCDIEKLIAATTYDMENNDKSADFVHMAQIKSFNDWLRRDITKKLFSQGNFEELDRIIEETQGLLHIDGSEIYSQSPKDAQIFVIMLLFKIMLNLDSDRKMVIALNCADFTCKMPPLLTAMLCDLLDTCNKENAVVLFTIEERDKTLRYSQTAHIVENFHNFMIVTDRMINREHRKILKLSDLEIYDIKKFTKEKNSFFLKRSDRSMMTKVIPWVDKKRDDKEKELGEGQDQG